MSRRLARLLLRLSRRLDPAPYGLARGGLIKGTPTTTTFTPPGAVIYGPFTAGPPAP